MRHSFRFIRLGFALLKLLFGLVLAAIAGAVWLSLPPAQQTIDMPGLSAPATVRFDQNGIPRIRAANLQDAAAALGYVHARDRMFQMELMRRLVSGELAEIAGPAALSSDLFMRRLGVRRAASADLPALDNGSRAVLEAYSHGVNAWINTRGRFASAESLVFGRPAPWKPVDSLLWAKLMGLFLSGNMRTELARLALAGKLPPERILELWPPDHGAGRPQAALDARYADAAAAILQSMPAFPQPFTQPATASNEWAVDGAHSATGAPLLAGDPHLAYSMPGIWYLVRMDLPGDVLVGASAPGVPLLVLGHNSHIAWTFTSTGADVQDVFEETPVDSTHYLGPAGPMPYETREERIHVRGAPDVVLTVRTTRHGPVMSDGMAGEGRILSVAMGNLAPGDTAAAGLLALNQAESVPAAGEAAARISSPVQNLLVADRERIGLFVTGRVPLRRSGDGAAPVPGADGAHDWTGFASGAQLPHVVAPPSGRLVNANDRIAPEDFPVFLGRDNYGDWRARRIRTMLSAAPRPSVVDFAAMQTDVTSAYAAQILPRLRAVPPADALSASALNLLSNWDGAMREDQPQPLIFNAWIAQFRRDVFAQHGLGPTVGAASPPAEFVAFVIAGAETPSGKWWCGGNCDRMLSAALTTATASLGPVYGPDPALWRWGRAHHALFADQALSGIPLLGPLTTAALATGGDDSTVGRAGMAPGSFDAVHGASYRAVYDLADLDRSRFMMAPGQSGNMFAQHARDFLRRWGAGEAITIGPDADHVSATLTVRPAHQAAQR